MATTRYRGLFLLAPRLSSTSFLYETATLKPGLLPFNRSLSYTFNHQQSSTNSFGPQDENASRSSEVSSSEGSDDVSSNDAHKPRGSFLRRRAAAVSSAPAVHDRSPHRPRRPKTMTSSEKRTIQDLMSQLEKEGIPVGSESAETVGGSRAEGDFSSIRFAESEDSKGESSRLSNPRGHSDELAEGASEKAEDILADLYKLQLSDLGMADPNNPGEDKLVTISEAMDLVIKRELNKIEAALFQAIGDKGDMGVWDVCQQRIFSMLEILETPNPTTPSGLVDAWPEPSAETASSEDLDIPSLLPRDLIVGKIYSKALVVAFRVLCTHFPDSSLIDDFRLAIKTKSPASAFLSTSRSLMADMILFYWLQRQDLPSVVSFLRDMHNSVVEPTRRTGDLLRDMKQQHDEDMAEAHSLEADFHPFWDLPPTRKAFEELFKPGGWMDKLNIPRRAGPDNRYGVHFQRL
ncbi:hypothetical protein N7492_002470 [Penicillium capsulatum]|uniref:Mtf2-like C-terminal domain-containing protein n=1 Tax=Penicillium capsulatum TaxID=69766 RepID=A0A9W9LVQ0_9EURO|nr:hypothetical protein N7492_002470 [Penicillium capsulatum]KAJ6122926.1 hypothetical protein N7512_005391 [Penicillium capsulatum]